MICSRIVCAQDGRTALSFAAKGAFERALAAGQDVDQRFKAYFNKQIFKTQVSESVSESVVCVCERERENAHGWVIGWVRG